MKQRNTRSQTTDKRDYQDYDLASDVIKALELLASEIEEIKVLHTDTV